MAATYTAKERCNDERPVADLGTLPTEQGHRMPDAVTSGYPNPTRYPVFLSIPDPIQF